MSEKIRIGIVGASLGSFIGPVHLMAARLDNEFELVCGAFSRDAARSKAAGQAYRLSPERSYDSFEAMFACEKARPGDGMECVIIATPNDSHFGIAMHGLECGLHVLSDKPATRTLGEAKILMATLRDSDRIYGLTYTYSGYPSVREARAICRSGRLGPIRKVLVEYLQGWLSLPIEKDGNPQAAWRTDAAQAGPGGCVADIGVHALHLLEFVTDCKVARLRAEVSTIVRDRNLPDDFNALLRLDNGARGMISASQVAAGMGNTLRIRVYGDLGGLDWDQENPQFLTLRWPGARAEVLTAGTNNPALTDAGRLASRLPVGHPEGYLEALGNIYRDFAVSIRTKRHVDTLPSIADGVRGMQFIDSVLHSAAADSLWIDMTAPN